MRCGTAGLAAALLLGSFSPGSTLEKTAAHAPDELLDEWSSGGTTTIVIQYYNLCTGSAWIWTDLQPGERIGVRYETSRFPDVEPTLTGSQLHFATTSPSGYGFTGTISVHASDANGCPTGAALASAPLLPQAGANVQAWNTIVPTGPPGWVLLFTNGPTPGLPVGFWSDRPSGPPGPATDCDLCYPASRPAHSFRYGTAAAPLCPGEWFDDPTGCPAELAWFVSGWFWEFQDPALSAGSVESRTWGSVKNLYR